MPTYVRVRDEFGHRCSVLDLEVAANPDAYEVLDEPAATRTGEPLPVQLAPSVAPSEPPTVPPPGGSLSLSRFITPRAGRPSTRRRSKR